MTKKIFGALIPLELKEILCRRNLMIMGTLMAIMLAFVQVSLIEYRLLDRDRAEFVKQERMSRENGIGAIQTEGTAKQLMFMPSPISIFFGSPNMMKRVRARIDTDNRVDVYASLLDKNVFETDGPDILSFSGFFIYCCSFLVMLLGFGGTRTREYNRFVYSTLLNRGHILTAKFISREIVVYGFILISGILGLLLASLNGVRFGDRDEIIFFIQFLVVAAFTQGIFISLGMIAGSVRSRSRGYLLLALFWFVSIILVPTVTGKAISLHSQGQVSDFSRDKSPELERRVNDHMTLSMLFPTTLYMAASREVGSRGYFNLGNFYGFAKKAVNSGLSGNVEDNVFYAASWVPGRMVWLHKILLILIVYRLFLVFLSAAPLSRSIFAVEAGFILDTDHLSLPATIGENRLVHAPPGMTRMVINRLTGEKGHWFQGEFGLKDADGNEVDCTGYTYLPDPDHIPGDLKVRALAHYVARIAGLSMAERSALAEQIKEVAHKSFKYLEPDEKAEVMLTMALFLKGNFLILSDFVKRMSLQGVRKMEAKLNTIMKNGTAVVYFNSFPTYNPPLKFKEAININREQGHYKQEILN